KNRPDQFFAFWGERYDPDAPILWTLDPAYQTSIQQAIDSHTDRARRKVHLWADRIHRQRPLVEECFQYPEVGIVDSRLLKSRIKIFRGRPKGLPQYQPTVDRVSRVLVHDKTILTLCVTNVQNNVSISIELASIDTKGALYKRNGQPTLVCAGSHKRIQQSQGGSSWQRIQSQFPKIWRQET